MGKVEIRQKKQRLKILIALRRGWSLSGAARYAELSRAQLCKWRREDPVFNAECEDAMEEGTDGLEDVAQSRAKRKSDVLMMFLLNGRRPDKYKRKSEVEVAPVTVQVKRFSEKKQKE